MVEKKDPRRFAQLLALAEETTNQRMSIYEQLAGLKVAAAVGRAPTPGNQG